MMQELENLREPLQYVTPGGAVDSIGVPTVPTAVLWGDTEQETSEFFLASLLSSRADPFPLTDANLYGDCLRMRRMIAKRKAKTSLQVALVQSTTNFFSNLLAAVGEFIDLESPGLGAILTFVGEFISGNGTLLAQQIEAVRQYDEELARLLRCELANQVLAARYVVLITEGELVLGEVDVADPDELLPCMMECADLNYEMNLDIDCDQYCDFETGTYTYPQISVPAYVFAPHDGLYSKEEQLLDGATVTIRLAGVNHFDEPKYFHPTVRQVYEDLFNGNSGPAFVIPPK